MHFFTKDGDCYAWLKFENSQIVEWDSYKYITEKVLGYINEQYVPVLMTLDLMRMQVTGRDVYKAMCRFQEQVSVCDTAVAE